MARVFRPSNATLPDVAIDIGGRERPMSFSYAMIHSLEEKHGMSVGQLLTQIDQLNVAVELLHAALWPDDQTLTIEQVAPWVSFLNLKVIQDAILAAWFGSVPERAEGEAPARARKRRRAK